MHLRKTFTVFVTLVRHFQSDVITMFIRLNDQKSQFITQI